MLESRRMRVKASGMKGRKHEREKGENKRGIIRCEKERKKEIMKNKIMLNKKKNRNGNENGDRNRKRTRGKKTWEEVLEDERRGKKY